MKKFTAALLLAFFSLPIVVVANEENNSVVNTMGSNIAMQASSTQVATLWKSTPESSDGRVWKLALMASMLVAVAGFILARTERDDVAAEYAILEDIIEGGEEIK